jgi:glycosyltransferase-like protein
MRIALLTYSTKPRGGVIHTMEVAEALHRLGESVCIFALDKDGGDFCRPLACPTQRVPTQASPPTMDQLVQQRIQEYVDFFWQYPKRYDIYHAQDCISANALVILRSQGYPIPCIIRTVHHIDDYSSPYLQDCQDKSIRQPDYCFCVSQYWQQELKRQYNINAPLVFNGVDTNRFTPHLDGSEAALKQALGITQSPFFLNIGGVEPRKNSLRLIQAFAQVRNTYPQAQLMIAGGITLFDYSDYRDRFFATVNQLQLKIGTDLLLPGMINDDVMPALYRCADSFVFPSVKEGWGLVVMEAIAAQLPVITADRPPFTEFLTPDQALLVDVENVEEIAIAMLHSLQPNTRTQLIHNSQTILQTYTWLNSARMHQHLYIRQTIN